MFSTIDASGQLRLMEIDAFAWSQIVQRAKGLERDDEAKNFT